MTPVTEWYPADIKPEHVGAYQVQAVGFDEQRWPWKFYSWWDGMCWRGLRATLGEVSGHDAPVSHRAWRGLASHPYTIDKLAG